MSFRVLLVEDDARLAAMVADYLGEAGFRVSIAPTGNQAESELRRETFDAVILDLMLPDADGLDLCRRIRARSALPLMMLTARAAIRSTAWLVWNWVPTTTCRSPSNPANCSRGSAPFCGDSAISHLPMCFASVVWKLTAERDGCSSTARRKISRHISTHCW